jgi:hypothetical protein
MTEWLAATERRRVVPRSRRVLRPRSTVVVLPDATLHAVKEDLATTACGKAPPEFVLGIWPMEGDVERCPRCLRAVGTPTLNAV